MNILILAQWCYPEPDLKTLPFAKELKRQGHNVEILTGFPNYPGGNLYKGYKVKFYQKEEIEGITVHRVPLYPSHDQSKIGRILNYVSFALSAALWGIFVTRKADIIYAYHPPATVSFPGVVLKYAKRAKLVYDIQDFWPDTLTATGMLNNKYILGLIDIYCRISYKFMDKIVVLSNGFRPKLMAKGVPSEKIEVIHNWCLDIKSHEYNVNEFKKEIGIEDKFSILFAGNMGPAQSLDIVIEAAKKVSANVQFVFLGNGIAKKTLLSKTESAGLSNVTFLDQVGREVVFKYLNAADSLLVHLKRDPLFKITIPSKIQAYLRVGKPILIGVEGEAAELVTKAKAGIYFEPQNVDSFVAAIEKMASATKAANFEMGQNGKNFYDQELSIDVGCKKFISIFEKLL